jgi:hypothetical protein
VQLELDCAQHDRCQCDGPGESEMRALLCSRSAASTAVPLPAGASEVAALAAVPQHESELELDQNFYVKNFEEKQFG